MSSTPMTLDEGGLKEDIPAPYPQQESQQDAERSTADKGALATERPYDEYYADLYLHAPVGYFTLDHQGHLFELNFLAAELLGHPRQSLLNTSLFDHIDPASHRDLREHLQQIFNSPGSHRCYIAVSLNRGTTAHLEMHSTARECPRSGALQCRTVLVDVAEHRLAGQQIQELREQLHRSQRMEALGRLASGVAHDFNNLLTLIIGYSKLSINQLPHDNPLARHAQQIHKAGRQASELIEQLLSFSRSLPASARQIVLNELVARSEPMLDRLIGDDIALHLSLDPHKGVVLADPTQLQQVLMTLIAYAREVMPEGGALYIRTRTLELDQQQAATLHLSPGPHVLLQVEDTGPAIKPDIIPFLSDPFFMVTNPGATHSFDLSTIYDIIAQKNGAIHVEGPPERGTVFSIYLPQIDPSPVTDENPTILVVDDQPDLRDFASLVLDQIGVELLQASSAQDALQAARAHANPIALIVTDVIMPDLSGPELVERIRRWHPDAQALYISGYDHETLCYERGIDPQAPFLEKPFTPDSLLKMAGELLKTHQKQ